MIDAYEIGIQLMLQEDVSAGLEVINRGLAEVDRAIAATSADLAGLVNKAEAATKAAAVAASGRAGLATASDPKNGKAVEQSAQTEPKKGTEEPSAISSGEKAAAPEKKAVEPSRPARPMADQSRDTGLPPQRNTREQTISSSAPLKSASDETVRVPVRSTGDEAVISDQRTNKTETKSVGLVFHIPAQVAPTARVSSEFAPLPTQKVRAAGQEPRRSATPSPTQVSLTASVSRAQRSEAAGAQSQPAWHQPTSGPTVRRERPIAPWSGVDHSGTHAGTTRLHEKAAAPQQTGRNQNESTGGTVMLDGRLVGQWVSEHMAREASRPPVGTSFFDPRQTPAWNVSGAL